MDNQLTEKEKQNLEKRANQLHEDIKELTDKDYETNLDSLINLKFKKVEWFVLEDDNTFGETIGDKPKYVEFNSEPYHYDKAVIKAINELYEMFKECNSYEEARNIIIITDPLNLCSEDRGYSVMPNTTGRFYGCWVILCGDDEDKTIYWDVRWY